jgi:Bacterial aa3 type cytochrome c oxidase subunit IV.
MAEHRRGDMDIEEQKKTFGRFTKLAGYVIVVVAVVLILLTFRI